VTGGYSGAMRSGLLALALVLLVTAPASAQQNPIFQSPGIPPAGANDPACKPAAAHPYPVILVHGTFADMTVSWNTIAPALESRGFCVWALDYGHRGTDDIDRSADQLVAFIDRVRAKTGAAKVSLVGHSQGGMLARYVAVRRDRLSVIDDIIGLSPSSHGTTNPLAGPAGAFGCTACDQQRARSAFMRKVNSPPPEAPGPAWYTVLTTTHDEVVTPYRSQALAGDHATNVILQDKCPADPTEHVGIIYDPVALEWAVDALERPGAANPRFQPDCTGRTYGHDPDAPPGSASAGGPPAAAPALRVSLARRAPGIERRRAGIRLTCHGPTGAICAGRLELRRTTPGRHYGASSFRITAGGTRTVRVRLSRAGARSFARRDRLAVRARALLPLPGGGVAVTARRYQLR
jgi:pimeloyl-ACP methyl ester carboxylesterase